MTLIEMITEILLKADKESLNKEVLSIGTWCGSDRPCDYTIRLSGNTEINIGERR